MYLTYRKNHGRLVEKKKFSEIIFRNAYEDESGDLEETKALARASICFTESLIDRLCLKGILNSEDIRNILKDIENVHPGAEIKVELNKA